MFRVELRVARAKIAFLATAVYIGAGSPKSGSEDELKESRADDGEPKVSSGKRWT